MWNSNTKSKGLSVVAAITANPPANNYSTKFGGMGRILPLETSCLMNSDLSCSHSSQQQKPDDEACPPTLPITTTTLENQSGNKANKEATRERSGSRRRADEVKWRLKFKKKNGYRFSLFSTVLASNEKILPSRWQHNVLEGHSKLSPDDSTSRQDLWWTFFFVSTKLYAYIEYIRT